MIKEIKLLDSCKVVGCTTNKVYYENIGKLFAFAILKDFDQTGELLGKEIDEELKIEQYLQSGETLVVAYTSN